MAQTLVLVHTSKVFLTVETMMQAMFAEIMPEVRLINIMDDSLLPDVMAEGRISTDVTRRMSAYVVAAEATGADAVLSLCSSLGPAIDVARRLVSIPVIKIDDAHTEKAAREADRIGVMATVATTLPPTVALIREKAAGLNKNVEIRESLSTAAFQALMHDEKDKHDAMVEEAARALAPQVDLILFAQASMTRLAPQIEQATGRPVLTSPRLAIEYTKRVLDELKAKKQAAGC
ncbi:MAG: aspartate/glutamate racemase family protein [Chloroflexi bacterium]|jgi:Asp/Glu/hydantoin racemase|nr:aspartate/glutamate racemase family protein [Chloroflexota bacterium]